MRHIISILLENEAGALSRVSGLFSARGYNIETLTVAPTEDLSLSRLTIVTSGSDDVIEQITKQLNKLIDVIKVVNLSEAAHIERELMLIKVRAAGKDRACPSRPASCRRRPASCRRRPPSRAAAAGVESTPSAAPSWATASRRSSRGA